mmetsp:Transcript_2713/g.6358  ORF Transcript_2713/g.6358 Transcript_2713/m.6358 type:complete len:432 (+) Transcript_2713:69-1364(+)|eukprot:CAMPEP_0171580382 /NCGR_PEP_ID=MMETSP0961-20121227/9005_1 /TAXON_ID=87120 /ORGANISM="Aurantiochytrium limacinum, Strain ATCCMYA-1381" /LENGTH=431 /DNA_ID=CAMNT_0012137049 /DNA_START=4 /DNA_END=1299 /DNA_ORIENTATION=+
MSHKPVSTTTPESYAAYQRKIKEDERRAKEHAKAMHAAKVAKARAARYNLTLRANELKKAREQAKAEAEAKFKGEDVATMEDASAKRKSLVKSVSKRFSQGVQSLRQSFGRQHTAASKDENQPLQGLVSQDGDVVQENAAQILPNAAMDPPRAEIPSTVRESHRMSSLQGSFRSKRSDLEEDGADARSSKANSIRKSVSSNKNETVEKHQSKNSRKSSRKSSRVSLRKSLNKNKNDLSAAAPGSQKGISSETSQDFVKDEHEYEEEGASNDGAADDHDDEDDDDDDGEVVLWMGELAHALEQQEAHEINAAILTAFLSELAPARVDEVEDLLAEYKGREEELFNDLARQYPVSPENHRQVNDKTFRALGAAIPDEAGEGSEEDGYILSMMGDQYGKWAANIQSHILRQRMLRAGASKEDVDAVMNNRSEMI